MTDLPSLRETIARHGLGASHALGQHFLLDPALTRRIADAAGDLSRGTTVEIGPGPGGLTRALLAAGAAHMLAIELDRRCLPALAELAAAYPGRLDIVEADAVGLDLAALARARGLPPPLRIVANLPYNAATAMLLAWLERIGDFERLVLMFQKEVAERLAAVPRTKAYGRLSVTTQWRCRVERLFTLPPGAFVPPPAVHSTVVRLTPHDAPPAPADPKKLERVVAAGFGQRRKMLRQSLRRLGVPPEPLLAAAGVDSTARAEELSVEQFCALARAL